MLRKIKYLFLFVFSATSVFSQKIELVKQSKHPWGLLDHGRMLRSYNLNGELIDSLIVYPNTGGEELLAAVFETDSSWIIIDGNGLWIYLDPKTCQFYDAQWKWNGNFPSSYIGVFLYDKKKKAYVINRVPIKKSDLYHYKDPRDCSGRFF